jgi:thiamine biosynthesis lipoprotein
MAIRLVLLLAFSALVTGCSQPPEPRTISRQALGTVIGITLYDKDSRTDAAADAAFDIIDGISRTMNRFDPESELSKLNAAAGKDWVPVSENLFSVIRDSVEYSRRTGGAFDATVLPVMKLWNFREEMPAAPSAEVVEGARSLTGWEKVALNPGDRRVFLPREGMGIDLGGIAKGYAVDRAAEELRRRGIRAAMVVGAGNIAVIGTPPGRRSWRIGVQHPRRKGETIGTLSIASGAVATSGDYERFVMIKGRRYSHIIDPASGWPVANNVVSVTIHAPTAEDADAYAKFVFVRGKDDGMRFVESQQGMGAVVITEEKEGTLKVWVSERLKGCYEPLK